MSAGDRHDPILVPRRVMPGYVYNARNPVGRALIVLTTVALVGFLYYIFDSSRWSEGEWRDAVNEAADTLEAKPYTLNGYTRYEDLIEEAVQATREGPEHSLIRVEAITDSSATAGKAAGTGQGPDTYVISTDDVDIIYCMRVSPPQPATTMSTRVVTLSVQLSKGDTDAAEPCRAP
ncbi:hypothetical protein [Streptomyces sp. NPDC054842]